MNRFQWSGYACLVCERLFALDVLDPFEGGYFKKINIL